MNKEQQKRKNRLAYHRNKITNKCVIKLEDEYIERVQHDPNTKWKHCTTADIEYAFQYNYYAARRTERYYKKLGIKTKIIFLPED